MRFLKATTIYPITSKPLKNGIIVLSESGIIMDLLEDSCDVDPGKIEYFEGSICPGFVNAHCHLELSHLKGTIPQKTGIVEFAKNIITKRNTFSEEEKQAAMELADAEMQANGIIAVGDISNENSSIGIKSKSSIHYHTFIELIGFNPANADKIIESGKSLLHEFKKTGLPGSLAAHAPYSVSTELMQLITVSNKNAISSIHNQESKTENNFFQSKTGDFCKLYEFLNLTIDYFKPTNKNSLPSYLPYLAKHSALALVHNTFSSKEDISFANEQSENLYWCLCPNANLYIEDSLPDVNLLNEEKCKIIIGTDSLASNFALDILSELAILKDKFPSFSTWQLLSWATLNGAQFLGIDSTFGSIEKSKAPGLVLFDEDKFKIKQILV